MRALNHDSPCFSQFLLVFPHFHPFAPISPCSPTFLPPFSTTYPCFLPPSLVLPMPWHVRVSMHSHSYREFFSLSHPRNLSVG